jgi:preprotein translocase subunit SecD
MRQLEKTDETYYLNPQPIVTVKSFTTIEFYENNYNGKLYYGLQMQCDKAGTEAWRQATRKAIYKKVAFILDNKLLFVATVNSEITNGVAVINSDKHSRAEFENIRAIIEAEK